MHGTETIQNCSLCQPEWPYLNPVKSKSNQNVTKSYVCSSSSSFKLGIRSKKSNNLCTFPRSGHETVNLDDPTPPFDLLYVHLELASARLRSQKPTVGSPFRLRPGDGAIRQASYGETGGIDLWHVSRAAPKEEDSLFRCCPLPIIIRYRRR